MTFTCADLPFILEDPDDPRWKWVEAHAEACPACRQELEFWRELSSSARGLHREWDTPELWPRIEASLTTEPSRSPVALETSHSKSFRAWWRIAAALLLTAVSLAVFWHLMPRSGTSDQESDSLLSESARARAEASEAAYLDTMARLEQAVQGELAAPDSALAASLRERLLAIDDAAAGLREEIERNRFNAELRNALLSVYAAREETLKELADYVTRSQRVL